LVPKEITSSYAFFPKLEQSSYIFQVTTENSEGSAQTASRIYVPPESGIKNPIVNGHSSNL